MPKQVKKQGMPCLYDLKYMLAFVPLFAFRKVQAWLSMSKTG